MSNLTRFKNLKIAIGVPSTGMWYMRFAICYCNMAIYFQTHKVMDYKSQMFQTLSVTGSILPKQRMEIVQGALEMGADYLLWLDCDHTFPRNLLHRLISHQKDVVAVNCVTKKIPSTPTARYKPTDPNDVKTSHPVFSDLDKPTLEKVWRVGTGIMLVDMKVYRKIGAEVFHMFYRKDVNTYQGEDWSMAEAMEQAGFDIWVDHPLSNQCGHIGMYEYTHDVVGEIKQEPVNVVPANAQAA